MIKDDSHCDPPSNLNRIPSHVSRIERAFGEGDTIDSEDPDAIAKAEELKKKIKEDRPVIAWDGYHRWRKTFDERERVVDARKFDLNANKLG